MTTNPVNTRKNLIQKNDRLFSLIVRSYGRCQKCGTTNNLECAHIVSRGYTILRWDRRNALCLCHSCHRWAHGHINIFIEWCQKIWKVDIDYLNDRKQKLEPISLDELHSIHTQLQKIQ